MHCRENSRQINIVLSFNLGIGYCIRKLGEIGSDGSGGGGVSNKNDSPRRALSRTQSIITCTLHSFVRHVTSYTMIIIRFKCLGR